MLYFYIPFLPFLVAIRTANLSFYLPIFFSRGQLSPHALPSSTKERLVRRYAKVVTNNFVTRSQQAFLFAWKLKKDKNANYVINADICLLFCCYFFDASSLSIEERIQFRKRGSDYRKLSLIVL